MDAIILAGGQGKRLRPLTDHMPKCMVPINGKPMIQYQIDWLKRYNVKKIVVAAGYKWKKIKEYYGDQLIYSVEKEPLGTGGAIKQALRYIDSHDYIVANCDDINNVDIRKLEKMGSNAVCLSKLPSPFGVVEIEKSMVKKFRQKPLLPHWVNIGIYLLNKNLELPDSGPIEDLVFTKVKLKAYKHTGYWITVNTEKDLEDAEKALNKK
ncbi:MAG: NDP-sugar synthase [Candidatus Aenigmarchaeota archaeon]|nr:NDP-sugar synthase [Candidatus Aenigmarchaeota archaeon]